MVSMMVSKTIHLGPSPNRPATKQLLQIDFELINVYMAFMKNISKSHSNKQVEVKCDYCGVNYLKDTKRVNANAKQGLKNYCCYNCQRNSKFSGTTEKCAYCGNDVYRSNAAKSRSSSGRVFCCKSHATSYNNQFKIDEKHPNFKTKV